MRRSNLRHIYYYDVENNVNAFCNYKIMFSEKQIDLFKSNNSNFDNNLNSNYEIENYKN